MLSALIMDVLAQLPVLKYLHFWCADYLALSIVFLYETVTHASNIEKAERGLACKATIQLPLQSVLFAIFSIFNDVMYACVWNNRTGKPPGGALM